MTFPRITSSICAGSTPARRMLSLTTRLPSSVALHDASPPMKLPIGVRQALIMTGCGINGQTNGGWNEVVTEISFEQTKVRSRRSLLDTLEVLDIRVHTHDDKNVPGPDLKFRFRDDGAHLSLSIGFPDRDKIYVVLIAEPKIFQCLSY